MSLGIVSEVVPDAALMNAATDWARRIVEASPKAVATCLETARLSLATPDLRAAMTTTYDAIDDLRASADFREGPIAFAEGRAPRWTS